METLLTSTGVVALAEIGDKTQLLALILATRFQKPLPIIAGILVATLLSHALAGVIGAWMTLIINPEVLRWLLGFSFIGMAIWALIPDKVDEEKTKTATRFGVFGATFIAFFLAEIGDKTQLATVAMAAHYPSPLLVIIGTTLGMLIANIPVVFFGDKVAAKIPIKVIRFIAAAIFTLLGFVTLLGLGIDVQLSN